MSCARRQVIAVALIPLQQSPAASDFAMRGQLVARQPWLIRTAASRCSALLFGSRTGTLVSFELQGVCSHLALCLSCTLHVCRRRWKFLGHLPLNGTFRLVEVTLTTPHLTPAQLAPMAEELSAREKRRKRRVEAARRESRREAAAAAAAAKARQGPTAAELMSMPRLGQGADMAEGGAGAAGAGAAAAGDLPAELQGLTPEQLEEALAAQAMHESALEADGAALGASPPSGGVSFARIAEMGFAATGPALGSSPAAAGSSGSSAPQAGAAGSAALKGAWGAASSSGKSAAARLSGAPSAGSGGGTAASGAAALLTKSSWGTGPSAAAARPASASGGEGAAAGSSGGAGAQQWLVLGGKEGGAAEGAGEGAAAPGSSKKSKKGVVLFATGQQRRY